ncbi:MAG: hypothetical protein JF616_09650 [Fibrobacteres bacterium]|jgi:hypothetical protein|nr:hypothetical protein [Fibrobacterota bacterium]
MSILKTLSSAPHRPFSAARSKRALALGFLGVLLPSIAARAQTTTPACGPGVREIFDFHVGDIFQYRIYSQDPVGMGHNKEVIRKYEVVSRNESGFIRTYDFSGLESRRSLIGNVVAEQSYNDYQETRAYLDTAGSPFNGCPGEIVRMIPDPDLNIRAGGGYTRVQALRGDTSKFALAGPDLRMKAYGGRELGRVQDSVIIPVLDWDEEGTYAEGLGLVYAYFRSLGPYTRVDLVGYVKDGDTVGVVSPDTSFRHTTALHSPAARRTGAGSLSAEAGGVLSAYDAQGRQLPGMAKRRSPTAAMPRFRK